MTEPAALRSRLRATADTFLALRPAVLAGEPWPLATDFGHGPEAAWGPPEVMAHLTEMLPYWLGEVERILAAPVEPVPYGRAPSDLIRLLTVDRDRSLPVSELYARLDFHLERVVRRLLELDDRQCARRGLHKTRGDLTIKQIVGENLAGHIEEHCTQMAASLES